jgi:hypothetical protein
MAGAGECKTRAMVERRKVFSMVVSIIAYQYPRLRFVEKELPDQLD